MAIKRASVSNLSESRFIRIDDDHINPEEIIIANGGAAPIRRPKWGASPLMIPGTSITINHKRRKIFLILKRNIINLRRPKSAIKLWKGSRKGRPGRL